MIVVVNVHLSVTKKVLHRQACADVHWNMISLKINAVGPIHPIFNRMKYFNFFLFRLVGDLDALCTKDSDCQRYMICSGISDGTRRCQCQNQYHYDTERRRCRKFFHLLIVNKDDWFLFFLLGGDYQSVCESNLDCRANLICNKSISPSFCSCELHYEYFPSLQKCRGYPGAVCDRPTAECVDNAECRDGACECSNQFVPDENRICGKLVVFWKVSLIVCSSRPLSGKNPQSTTYSLSRQLSTIYRLSTEVCSYSIEFEIDILLSFLDRKQNVRIDII